jgi:hypothetical protein
MTSRREWPEAVPCRSCGRTTVPAQVGARRKLVWLNSDSEGRPRRYRDDLSGNRYGIAGPAQSPRAAIFQGGATP